MEEKRTRLTTSRKERDKLVLWRIHVEQELINTAIIRATAPNSVQYLCRFPISGNIETADIANGNTQQLSSTMAATATPLVKVPYRVETFRFFFFVVVVGFGAFYSVMSHTQVSVESKYNGRKKKKAKFSNQKKKENV